MSTARATKPAQQQCWDETTFFEHAAQHRPAAELRLMRQLVDYAEATGGRLIWRRGGLPGASVWYEIGGELTAVYGLSAGDASTPASVFLYLADLPAILGHDHLARVRAELEPVRAGDAVWMTRLLLLGDLAKAAAGAESLLKLITRITGGPRRP
jgi:hypothetical protein